MPCLHNTISIIPKKTNYYYEKPYYCAHCNQIIPRGEEYYNYCVDCNKIILPCEVNIINKRVCCRYKLKIE
jgi:hypothetical protein